MLVSRDAAVNAGAGLSVGIVGGFVLGFMMYGWVAGDAAPPIVSQSVSVSTSTPPAALPGNEGGETDSPFTPSQAGTGKVASDASARSATDDRPQAPPAKANSGIDALHPRQALQALLARGLDESDSEAIQRILERWMAEDPEQAMRWLQAGAGDERTESLVTEALHVWLDSDADSALAMIATQPIDETTPYLLSHYARNIAKAAPEQAIQWTRGLVNPALRQQVVDDLVTDWAASDPARLAEHIANAEAAGDTAFSERAKTELAAAWALSDPAGALQWSQSQPAQSQDELESTITRQWLYDDPEGAGRWLTTQGAESIPDAALTVLPEQNLPVAMELFPSLDPADQQVMAEDMGYHLMLEGAAQANAFVDSLADEQQRATVQEGMIAAALQRDPQAALQVAEHVGGHNRNAVLTQTAIEVARLDPLMVNDWLQSAVLTPNERFELGERLREQADRSRR